MARLPVGLAMFGFVLTKILDAQLGQIRADNANLRATLKARFEVNARSL